MATKIFVNLPVTDLNKAIEFFTKLGYTFNPQFTDETATGMIVSEDIYVMLLTHEKFKTFTPNQICDATKSTDDDANFSHYFEEVNTMLFVTTLDVNGLTPEEYRAILDEMGVEARPADGIFLHLTTTTDFGYRIVEVWDSKEGFEEFLENRLGPASTAIGLNRKTNTSITPLHNFFGPRLKELPGLISTLPGAPMTKVRE